MKKSYETLLWGDTHMKWEKKLTDMPAAVSNVYEILHCFIVTYQRLRVLNWKNIRFYLY